MKKLIPENLNGLSHKEKVIYATASNETELIAVLFPASLSIAYANLLANDVSDAMELIFTYSDVEFNPSMFDQEYKDLIKLRISSIIKTVQLLTIDSPRVSKGDYMLFPSLIEFLTEIQTSIS